MEREQLEQIIQAGRFTQTSTNNQDVSYIVITDKITEIREMAYESLRKKGEHILANMTPETEYLGLTKQNPLISCFVIGYPNVKYQRTVPRKEAQIRWL